MVEVGYKFRFFGDDAEKAAAVLGIVAYYSHSFLTASIPTFRLHVHVRRLVEAGYKVGVVKQTETAAIKAHGSNRGGPFSRGLSAIYTKGTLEAGEFLRGDEGDEIRISSYIMCVVEESITESKASAARDEVRGSFDARFGVVAVETSTGDVMYGHFADSVTRTELEARLLACAPAELLLTASLSNSTKKLLLEYAEASEVRVEETSENAYKDGGAVAALADFYGSTTTTTTEKTDPEEKVDGGLEALMTMPEIVVAAFAHILVYLKQFNLENVLRLGALFRPFAGQQEMVLSPNTICQLEILRNQTDYTENGSLFWLMNHTKTSFGARLLRYWITHPLKDRMLISQRLDAVAEIAESIGDKGKDTTGGTLASSFLLLGKLPDVERGITRIYHKTATSYEFINVIKAIVGASTQFQRVQARSALLSRLISTVTSSSVIDHASNLVTSLNAEAAAAADKINLFVAGQYPEVDELKAKITSIEEELEGLLSGYRKLLKNSKLEYLSVSGTSFLIEVSGSQRVPADWVKINSTKKANRYHTPEVLQGLEKLAVAKEQLNLACDKGWDLFLTDFASYYMEFRAAVQALAALDCLYSLAVVSCNQRYVRPEFVDDSQPCLLKIEAGRHPVLDSTLQDGFVPNDTDLSGDAEVAQVITGPNMGGKSCYIRQVALITIMAQMGSYVPASTAKLRVFDAVFTRMGAMDRLQRGSSTFFEELSETSAILHKATSHSMVVIDELGRGTSTHDGVAIAYATICHLLREIKCLTLFVTHYLKVAEVVKLFPGRVQAYHMSYLAESSGSNLEKTVEEVAKKVTFLYKLEPGAASRSFGIHVARLATIPESCVLRAAEKAAEFEEEMSSRRSRVDLEQENKKLAAFSMLQQGLLNKDLKSLRLKIQELVS